MSSCNATNEKASATTSKTEQATAQVVEALARCSPQIHAREVETDRSHYSGGGLTTTNGTIRLDHGVMLHVTPGLVKCTLNLSFDPERAAEIVPLIMALAEREKAR